MDTTRTPCGKGTPYRTQSEYTSQDCTRIGTAFAYEWTDQGRSELIVRVDRNGNPLLGAASQ